jgi:zinc transporter 9
VYLRSDVEAKAISIWGSLENIAREKEKRRQEYEQRRQAIFNLKKTLRDYQNKIDSLENPLNDIKFTNSTIYNTFSGKVVLSAVAVYTKN